MSIATLSIDINASLARFESGMSRAEQIATKQANAIDKAFSGVGKTIAGLGIAAFAYQLTSQYKAALATADSMDDLGEKYGIAAGKLSEYRYAAEVAGTPTESLAKGLQQLSKAASEGSKGFALIGVATKDSAGNLRDTDSLLLDVAEKFARYEDGAAKAALAQALFGKSGVEMIPLLNRGKSGIAGLRDEAVKLGAAFGDDVAKQAGEFNDNLKRLELAAEGAKVALVGSLLPSLIAVTEQLIAGKKAYGGWLQATLDIGLNVDPFTTIAGNIESTSRELVVAKENLAKYEAANKSFLATINPIFAGGSRVMIEGLKNEIELLGKRQVYLKSEQARQALLGSSGDYSNEARNAMAKLKAPGLEPKTAATVNDAAKAYEEFLHKIQQRILRADEETKAGRKLTESESERIKLLDELTKVTDKLGISQKVEGESLVNSLLVRLRSKEALDEEKKARDGILAVQKANEAILQRSLDGHEREIGYIAQGNAYLRMQFEEYGLSATALEDLTLRRIDDAIAIERYNLMAAQSVEGNDLESQAIERKVRVLEQELALHTKGIQLARTQRNDPVAGATGAINDYLETVVRAGEATRQAVSSSMGALENDLTNSLLKGKLDVSSFVNTVISEMLRLQVVRPLLSSIFGGGGSGGFDFAGMFAGMFGGSRAFGGPVSAGKIYEVNERGSPEMLTMGSRQMLLMGNQGGRITPSTAGSGGGGMTVINNVQAGVSRGEMMSALQLAMQGTEARMMQRLRMERTI